MHIVCLDMEGVLVPEIWINVSLKTGIEELKLTTRDISDYDVLMKKRIGLLEKHKLTIGDIQSVIRTMDPLPGGREFLDELRAKTQVLILSDTFTQFAAPLMEKLAWPTLFCNTLMIDGLGRVTDYRLRIKDGKKKTVEALHSIGFTVTAAGDSYNDVTMLKSADKGIFFRPPASILKEFPDLPVTETFAELMAEIDAFIGA
ncbi:MAG: bifunctional phosphoserine phosphatase/homoserine phosphotransferase ThrH [Spirochaetales bacterium]|nr:MAG: bifunctional phosphoserine phosphatase/homoserine phosphotransferase ThrH [Spirochaetales bacterium]